MKLLKFSILMMAGIIIFITCSSAKNNNSETQNIHRKWMMTEYKNFTKEELVKLNAYIDLSENPVVKNKYGAKMGCNNMFFTAEFKNGKAKFSQIGSTMMYCEGRMKLEEAFGKDLPEMNTYKIEGHFLILSDGKENRMKFVAADWD